MFSILNQKSLLYIFAFFDGLSVAAGALFGFFFPKLLSDVFGANFQTNDLIWFKFVLLPGIAINVLYIYSMESFVYIRLLELIVVT